MTRSIFAFVIASLLAAACTAEAPAGERGTQPGAPAGDAARQPAGTAATAGDDFRASGRDERGVVLFVGTSLTAGYGIGEEFAYPARLQEKIDSAGLPFRVANAGISGETSAGGLARIDWMLQRPIDVLVLELGANDGLRGLDVAALRANLDAIIRRTKNAHPDADIILAGMEAPPNLGESYTRAFRRVYTDLAREHDLPLVPFLLDGVAAEPALNLDDGIHPNQAGQRRVAANVWPVLEAVLARRAAEQ
jgi:acyl-CoA thioesterase I